MNRRAGLSVLMTVLVAVVACDQPRGPGSSSRPSDTESSPSAPAVPVRDTVERVVASIRVGPGLRPYLTVFHDAEHGYAVLSDCPYRAATPGLRLPERRCRGALLATADGGRTWSPRVLPLAESGDWILTTGGPREVVLFAGRRFYQSVDAGMSFVESRERDGPIVLDGRGELGQVVPTNARVVCALPRVESCAGYQVLTLDRATGAVVRRSAPVELDGEAGIRPQAAALAGRLVLTMWEPGRRQPDRPPPRLQSVVTTDEGRTWTWMDPLEVGGRATLHGSLDGADAWVVPVLRPAVFPELRRLVGDRWLVVPATGHPTAPGRYWAAAVGGGRLAVAGPGGFGYASAEGGWSTDPRPPAGLDQVDLLADGALALTARSEPHRLLLGVGSADRRNWTEVVISPS
ncbi:hypothetical protein [Plantactinospora soyae]|uniref:Uncharacterized protein n=1 Tax=Plantactinospora soyae TaxID=1544732 RepID=A0A927R0B2_9ACTN|nr:hypothetical protein [Plantactinospora soyae]MBE1491370.1 hypothetical protein [Plantactinospora soyae]